MYSPSFLIRHPSWEITIALMFAMILFYWIGLRMRVFVFKRTEHKPDSIGTIEGSLLGLLALMLSFTFSMSSGRHDKRIDIIIQEANNIGTAVLRADLYPDSLRIPLRQELKKYLEARINFYEVGSDLKKVSVANDSAVAIQNRIWAIAAKAGQDKEHLHRTAQMIPALNDMIDIVTTRNAALIAKVPDLIIYLLFLLSLTSSFILGYSGGAKNDWLVSISFTIMISLAVFMILDLDRPRTGIITSKDANQQIIALRAMFK